MNLSEFIKSLDGKIDSDQAFRLYTQTKINILEEFVRQQSSMSDDRWEALQKRIFQSVIDAIKK